LPSLPASRLAMKMVEGSLETLKFGFGKDKSTAAEQH
jgi:hypothetical protein